MSQQDYTQNILSKYVLEIIFSHLQLNTFYKIIKYNKIIQNRLDIDWKDSVFKYNNVYVIKTKSQIMEGIEEMQNKPKYGEYVSYLSYSSKFCLKYNYHFIENIHEENEEIKFLKKYEGFKINDYPLPTNFDSLNLKEKMDLLKKYECHFQYSLKDKNVELINSINELREKNNISLLIYNKLENLDTFFNEEKLNNDSHIFIYSLGEFKNKLVKKEEDIIKILLKKNFRYIIILEKEHQEYIFLYSEREQKIDINAENKLNNNEKINNYENFHIINDTKPEIKIDESFQIPKYLKFHLRKNICSCDNGYQILNIFNDTLIGVLEGAPDTPYENGYFLFKILFPKDFPFEPIKFCFITPIFHPNISENGLVCVDIFDDQWTPAICIFYKFIISVQSLLDDPNPDDFFNETAAKLYKKDRNIYNETVRCHTSKFANYSKFLKDLINLNIDYEALNIKKNK